MAGNIKVIEATSRYQKVSKGIIFDKEIDPFTLGIYVKVVALGKEWDLNVVGFAAHLGMTEAKIRKAFSALEIAGYIRRIHLKDPKTGRFTGWDYEIGVDPFPEADRSNLMKTHPVENPKGGKPKVWETQTLENREGVNKDYTEIKTKKEVENKFNFKDALLGLGVSPSTAEQWMEVRKKKGAVNTELAFKDLCTEIAKAGQPAEECVRISVANSWRGFKAEYLRPRNLVGSSPQAPLRQQQESVYERNARALAEFQNRLNIQYADEQ